MGTADEPPSLQSAIVTSAWLELPLQSRWSFCQLIRLMLRLYLRQHGGHFFSALLPGEDGAGEAVPCFLTNKETTGGSETVCSGRDRIKMHEFLTADSCGLHCLLGGISGQFGSDQSGSDRLSACCTQGISKTTFKLKI